MMVFTFLAPPMTVIIAAFFIGVHGTCVQKHWEHGHD